MLVLQVRCRVGLDSEHRQSAIIEMLGFFKVSMALETRSADCVSAVRLPFAGPALKPRSFRVCCTLRTTAGL